MHQLRAFHKSITSLIVSDALDMGALSGEYPPDEIAVRVVEAGMDNLLHPADARAAIDAVVKAVGTGRLTEERIHESVERIMIPKKRLGLFILKRKAGPAVNRERHRKIAQELGRKALRVVGGDRKELPLDPPQGSGMLHP